MFTHVNCYSFAWSTDSIRFIATQSRCGRAKRHFGPERACQWDGRINSQKRYNLRGSAPPTRALYRQPGVNKYNLDSADSSHTRRS